MEAANKIDIKSEAYRAAMPHIANFTKDAFSRYKELPRGEVFKIFAVVYLMAGFVVSSVAGAIPSMVLHFFHMSSTLIDVAFIGFWPLIAWVIGSKESVLISLGMIFVLAIYISHLRNRASDATSALAGAKTRIASLEAQSPQMIDVTPVVALGAADPR
jgi:hypothetical protein